VSPRSGIGLPGSGRPTGPGRSAAPGAGPGAGRGAGPGARQSSFEDATALVETTFVVLDLETTGLSPDRDRITEVGAVRARGGEVLAELRTFVHPGVPIPAAVTAITGITDADVAHAPDVATVLPTVLDFLGDAVLVAHNARFDLGFLQAAATRLGLPAVRPRVIDTAVLARRLIRDEVRDVRLGTLARHLRAPDTPDHRALNDARATLHVLHALIERASGYGATTIEDLQQLCGPTGDRSHRRIALIEDAPSAPGVYRFLAEDGTVLYVGKATDLRRRLRSYFGQDTRRRTADLVAATARVTWTVVPTELEAAVMELRELQASRPRYNHRSTRPDTGVTVTLTREPFPRLAIVRGAPDADGAGLGPVPRSVAQLVVEGIEAVVPLRPCRPRLRRAQDNPACMLKDLHRCDAVCDGTQTPEAYTAVVERAREVMHDPTGLLDVLEERMREEAGAGAFERAAERREQLAAIVRAHDARRHHDLMRGAELVLERPRVIHDGAARTTVVEVVTLSEGSVVASHVEPAVAPRDARPRPLPLARPLPLQEGSDAIADGVAEADATGWGDADAADDAADGPTTSATTGREEADLVRRWLASDDVRVRHVTGVLASPVAGGRRLATLRAELRSASRSARGDEVVLSGGKVRRRGTPPGADGGPLTPPHDPRPT
jgi:DNA polymerase-3 subunit epsilon